jgi:hypothetical protein
MMLPVPPLAALLKQPAVTPVDQVGGGMGAGSFMAPPERAKYSPKLAALIKKRAEAGSLPTAAEEMIRGSR